MAELPERDWTLPGVAGNRLTVRQVAEYFGYEVKTWRQMVRDGFMPAPRGKGQGEFYKGSDVACIIEMFGRWGPQRDEEPAETDGPESARNSPKVPETVRKRPKSAEDSDS